MEAQEDFKELLALFNAHSVAYVIVGAYALSYHGAPRFVKNKRLTGRQKDLADLEALGEEWFKKFR